MYKAISLDGVAPTERPQWFAQGVSNCIHYLASTFPAEQDYVHKVEERAAKWAWRQTNARSDRQALTMLAPALGERAVRRAIRITKGLNWGLTIDIQSGDRELSFCALTVLAESTLMVLLIGGGFGLGLLPAIGIGMLSASVGAGLCIGLILGAVLAGVGWLISRPLQGVPREQLSELIEILARRLQGSGSPNG
jgi:hypothetical protein